MIILNYCNLIATSRHRAETSSRGRGRAGAEAGSGVAAGRPCSIGPSVAKMCARGEPGEREPQLPGGGIGIRPSGATQLGLAVGSRCLGTLELRLGAVLAARHGTGPVAPRARSG